MAYGRKYDYSARQARGSFYTKYVEGEEFEQEGYFKSTRFYNEESGFLIGTFVPKKGEPIVCKGTVPGFLLGGGYRVKGKVVVDPKWGIQVKMNECYSVVPTTGKGIVAFLSSGVIPGVGPATAKRIYETFGNDTMAILQDDPTRLKEVKGIGEKNIVKIVDRLPKVLRYQEQIGFFAQFGISTATITRLIDEYGDAAKAKMEENPYILTRVQGFAFSRADAIAMKMGFPIDHPRRLDAGVLYTLRWACENRGHTLLPKEQLVSLASEKLGNIDVKLIDAALNRLIGRSALVSDDLGIHLKTLYNAEKTIKDYLAHNAVKPDILVEEEDVEDLARAVTARTGLSLSDEQMTAVKKLYSRKVSIMTGSAGTGKTSACKMVVEIANDCDIPVCLVSPTGRAAKHLSEVCGAPGFTIHRALSIFVKSANSADMLSEAEIVASAKMTDANETFENAKIIIADEVSMMDTELAAYLFQACSGKHLMMVGDPNQLPSVGPGKVLADLLESSYADGIVTRLTKIFRQADGSPIITAAQMILEGKSPVNVKGINFLECDNLHVPDRFDETIIPMVYKRKLGNTDFSVLAPMKKTPYSGVHALNDYLRPKLNPSYKKPDNPKKEFLLQEGDYVMQIRNNYEVDIYNGDIGIVDYVDKDGNVGIIFSDSDDVLEYTKDEATDQLVLCYAQSVHKSQGAEYDTVVVVMTSSHYAMLFRNLLYTAVTRASKNLYLVGDRKAFSMAASNTRDNNRMTGLKGL